MKAKTASERRLNVTGLALALGVNRSNLSGHLKRSDAPKRGKDGCYNANAVRRYLADRRRLNNDAGAGVPNEELYRLRCEKLTLEVESLRRDLQLAGERVSLAELSGWLSRFLDEVAISLPSATRPGLVMALGRVEGNHAAPIAILRECTAWADGVRHALVDYCRGHGIEVRAGSTVHRPDMAAILGRSYLGADMADRDFSDLPSQIDRGDVLQAMQELRDALRAAGVTEATFRKAAAVFSEREVVVQQTPVIRQKEQR
jgi:DNA-binding transcriptional ArsR family regulator